MEKNIAVLEGDGIGPEIMREGLKVLDSISKKYSHKFNITKAPFGAQAFFDQGNTFPDATKGIIDQSDATLKGPVGLSLDKMKELQAKGVQLELETVLGLRAQLDTYANLRPVYLPKQFAHFSPLKPEIIGDGIDILMVRELVGGNYFGKKVESTETNEKYAIDEGKYTNDQIDRIAHFAFNEAVRKRSKLTNVSKTNVMANGRFWNKRVDIVAESYPDVKLENAIVDAVCFNLVKNPTQYNGVMLLENMQGDLVTDEGAGLLGSLGLMPSACLNPETGKGYFEPAHGSAPDIAGQNMANPYSMIGSVAFMLEKSFDLKDEADDVWNALTKVFGDGYMTRELVEKTTSPDKILKTNEFGDRVVSSILESKLQEA